MSIVVNMSLPPDALGLGAVFEEHPEARIDLERVVPASDAFLPYIWLSNGGSDFDHIAETIREHPDTKSLTKLTETGNKALFEVVWAGSVDHLMTAFSEGHDGCIQAVGTEDEWTLEIRFQNHERLTGFNNALTEAEIPVTLHRVEEYAPDGNPLLLSEEQREAIALAHDRGYFAVPRECTIGDLADEAAISPSAFSERLRRGLDNLAGVADLSIDHTA